MIMHIQSSLFKHFQGYIGIFRDIDADSAKLRGTQLGERAEASPAIFENRKKCPDFGKKDRDCAYFWVTFFIQNVVLGEPRGKNSKMFPYGVSFSCVFDEIFCRSALVPQTLPPPTVFFENAPS